MTQPDDQVQYSEDRNYWWDEHASIWQPVDATAHAHSGSGAGSGSGSAAVESPPPVTTTTWVRACGRWGRSGG